MSLTSGGRVAMGGAAAGSTTDALAGPRTSQRAAMLAVTSADQVGNALAARCTRSWSHSRLYRKDRTAGSRS